MDIKTYESLINNLWETKDYLSELPGGLSEAKEIIYKVIEALNLGSITVAGIKPGEPLINEWVKKAILLYFKVTDSKLFQDELTVRYDKIDDKFTGYTQEDFVKGGFRIVPGARVRTGSYIGPNAVIMPSFINIGAYVGAGTMIDSWATVGSCAYVGNNCHISGGAGIGGVLEPIGAKPVVIEDDCFIGARSEIAEGVRVGKGSVIAMGVFIGASTKIVYRDTGRIIYGEVPPYSVVVPGSYPSPGRGAPHLYCAVIIKSVDAGTRAKTQINALLRD